MYYNSLNNHYKNKFGEKVYKLSISAKVTCPNRDGNIDTRGCIFCSDSGSGEFAIHGKSVSEQIEKAKILVEKKIKNGKYIAYFQSFTNTYAPIEYLREIFYEAINNQDIVGLAIATRPDCIDKNVLELLEDLNKIKPVYLELGLQTSKESSVKYIRRGYENNCYVEAVKELKKINVNVVTHIIIGLPYENEEDILNTVRFVSENKTDGVKLHLLHILKNTDLEKEYKEGKFKELELNEYINILCKCIEILPKEIVIHRMTGDGAKNMLVAPLWSADKKRVLNSINKEFRIRNIEQGSKS